MHGVQIKQVETRLKDKTNDHCVLLAQLLAILW
jgi:hypothetical protein